MASKKSDLVGYRAIAKQLGLRDAAVRKLEQAALKKCLEFCYKRGINFDDLIDRNRSIGRNHSSIDDC